MNSDEVYHLLLSYEAERKIIAVAFPKNSEHSSIVKLELQYKDLEIELRNCCESVSIIICDLVAIRKTIYQLPAAAEWFILFTPSYRPIYH